MHSNIEVPRDARRHRSVCGTTGVMLAPVVALLLVGSAVADTAPDIDTIVSKMKAALEPEVPSVRTMEIAVSTEEGEVRRWTAAQARKRIGDVGYMLTVLLAPEDVKGNALLIIERGKEPDEHWVYLPSVRRVRRVEPVGKYQAFLSTDFTFADFGFVTLDRTYELLGTEEFEGRRAYKIEEVPRERWFYSRIVSWVAADTWFPIRREFYTPAGELWKLERFDQVTRIDGIPTSLRMQMEDVRQRGTSEINVTKISYKAEIPDNLFDPRRLGQAIDSPVWSATGS
jgi:outer membrane lipoprotein-sorting protein